MAGSTKLVVPTMEQPKLLALDEESVRAFFAKYDAYADAARENAKQFGEDMTTAPPANLKYCVDHDQLEVAIDTEFLERIYTIKDRDDSKLREFFEKQISANNMAVSNAELDVII